jgi:glucosylceramidase
MKIFKTALFLFFAMPAYSCFAQNGVSWWLTSSDKVALLTKQTPLSFGSDNNSSSTIAINAAKKYQYVDGFGFALTGGSAQLMMRMAPAERKKLINEVFGKTGNEIGVSYLRLSIGSSDLNDHTFSYDDVASGATDLGLQHFTLKEDEKDVIPVMKEILAVNPDIKVLGSPWSAPLWMKSNENIQGGRLKDEYYPVYAKYLAKYITAMKQHGITIDAITVQNEPFNDGNTPSMMFLAKEEMHFIANNLGPEFTKQGIKTKIILFDHNCDAPEYPISILTDPAAYKYIAGSGFHLYAGNISALSKVHYAFPEKNLYFTEQMVVTRDDFNVANPEERVVIGALRNWSKNVILWNLAADANNNPHTPNGGCPSCQGAVTIEGDNVSRNLAYYTIAHVSKFVPPGSVRVESTAPDGLSNVAFHTPAGKTVLIVANKGKESRSFNITDNGKTIPVTLTGESVATYVW